MTLDQILGRPKTFTEDWGDALRSHRLNVQTLGYLPATQYVLIPGLSGFRTPNTSQ